MVGDLDWPEIYRRLKLNYEDEVAWMALEGRVREWARPALWQNGWHVVDDVVADTCATVALAIAQARGAPTFAGFVYGHFLNARNRALAERRALVEPIEIDPPAAEPTLPTPDEIELLRQCLARLSERERLAVEQRYLDDAPYAAVAELLLVAENNARQIAFRGLARLRECVRGAWPLGRG